MFTRRYLTQTTNLALVHLRSSSSTSSVSSLFSSTRLNIMSQQQQYHVRTVAPPQQKHASSSIDASSSSSSQQPTPHRILCFGASLTEGLTDGCTAMHPYALKLSEKLHAAGENVSVEEAGQSGEMSLTMVKRLEGILAQQKQQQTKSKSQSSQQQQQLPYSLILILGGTNDVFNSFSASSIAERLRRMHATCHAHSPFTHTIALTLPEAYMPVPGSAEDRAERSESREVAAVMVDVNGKMKEWEKEKGVAASTAAASSSSTTATSPIAATSASLTSSFDPTRFSIFDLRSLMPQHTSATSRYWDDDGIHFSREGYDFVGGKLAEFVLEKEVLRKVEERRSKLGMSVSASADHAEAAKQ